MAYTRVNWKNNEDGGTALNAANLNIMDKGIADVNSDVSTLSLNISQNYATRAYVDEQVGNIGTALDAINGKVV